MKKSKVLLTLATAMTVSAMQCEAQNVQAQVHKKNNKIELIPGIWIKYSADPNYTDDGKNFSIDLARHSDDHNFELIVGARIGNHISSKTKIKLFALLDELERSPDDYIQNPHERLVAGLMLARGRERGVYGFMENVLHNPNVLPIVIEGYADKCMRDAVVSQEPPVDPVALRQKLRESVFSQDENGKTSLDIVNEKREKSDHAGAAVLRVILNDIKEDFEQEDRRVAQQQEQELRDTLGLGE